MASWSRCNRHGTAPLQTIYINLDHVITVERSQGVHIGQVR